MVARFELEADVSDIIADLRKRLPNQTRRITSRAINRVGRDIERDAISDISDKLRVQKSRIRWRYDKNGKKTNRRRLPVRFATIKDPTWSAGWIPRGRDPVVSVMSMGARQNKRGVRAGELFIQSAFIQEVNNAEQVWKRRGKERYPIDRQVVELEPFATTTFRRLINNSGRRYRREFDRLAKLVLER